MDDSMSSTNHNKNKAHFSGDASEDSGWSSYFDNSVASSNVEDAATCSGSESSSIFSYAAASVGKMHPNDDCVVSARSVAKRRKTRATFIDHDLEDTATSPVCNFEAQDLEQLQLNLQETGCSLNFSPPMQQGKHDYLSFFQDKQNTSNQTGEATQSDYVGKDINYAGLKEKGLCLVPVSLLFKVW
ncbi:uncharacterized protein [Spinacia oleracea]|uniref:Uncharacterized protein n=1 Tax=Spinacia oleracea TaxID=3562 RepID=A0A9R0IVT4_SPIOL|nr:uncharacterized protein LOC110795751 [Spinacia oleracea]